MASSDDSLASQRFHKEIPSSEKGEILKLNFHCCPGRLWLQFPFIMVTSLPLTHVIVPLL